MGEEKLLDARATFYSLISSMYTCRKNESLGECGMKGIHRAAVKVYREIQKNGIGNVERACLEQAQLELKLEDKT